MQTPYPDMWTAIVHRDAAALTRMLAAGRATANDRAPGGDHALQFALGVGDAELVRVLLEHGADVHAPVGDQSAGSFTVLDDVFGNATLAGDTTQLSVLLDAGMDVNLESDGLTMLMRAAVQSVELTEFLLHRGADPNRQNSNGTTAIMFAADPDTPSLGPEMAMRIVMLLIRYGADVRMQNRKGYTARKILNARGVHAARYFSISNVLEVAERGKKE